MRFCLHSVTVLHGLNSFWPKLNQSATSSSGHAQRNFKLKKIPENMRIEKLYSVMHLPWKKKKFSQLLPTPNKNGGRNFDSGRCSSGLIGVFLGRNFKSYPRLHLVYQQCHFNLGSTNGRGFHKFANSLFGVHFGCYRSYNPLVYLQNCHQNSIGGRSQ